MGKGLTISLEEADVLVESKTTKNGDVIRMHPIGSKKEHILKFEVGRV